MSLVRVVRSHRVLSLPLLPSFKGIFEVLGKRLRENASVDEHSTNKIWINIAGWAPILYISFAFVGGCGRGDAERRSSITNAVGELVDRRGFMVTSQSLLVVITIHFNVFLMPRCKLSHHEMNVLHATGSCTHSLGREVGVAARAIPVLEKLGGERDVDVEVLSNASKNVARHPEVISDGNALDRADLVFPLAGHDFCVGA